MIDALIIASMLGSMAAAIKLGRRYWWVPFLVPVTLMVVVQFVLSHDAMTAFYIGALASSLLATGWLLWRRGLRAREKVDPGQPQCTGGACASSFYSVPAAMSSARASGWKRSSRTTDSARHRAEPGPGPTTPSRPRRDGSAPPAG